MKQFGYLKVVNPPAPLPADEGRKLLDHLLRGVSHEEFARRVREWQVEEHLLDDAA